jgi:hypothetical protein
MPQLLPTLRLIKCWNVKVFNQVELPWQRTNNDTPKTSKEENMKVS